MIRFVLFYLLLMVNVVSAQNDEVIIYNPVPDRIAAYPLKDQSLLFTADRIQWAHDKIANNDNAKKVKQDILASVEQWLSWKDEDLIHLIADASVPRSFDLSAGGCPIHGDTIFKIAGAYPWVIDPKLPFKVQCPVGKEEYPSNDYESYYRDGFQNKVDVDLAYGDDGWGWTGSDNKKYWFVAYANHWMFMDFIQPAIRDLGRAYVLTKDARYAHKALVLLHRLAEVYPSMDYENQSRYGLMQKKEGRRYLGKVLNRIWEAFFIKDVAECYDAVWSHIKADKALQKLLSKDAIEIQSFIEANILEEAVSAYENREIQGNFGMHQIALLYVMMARQNLDNEKLIHRILNNKSSEYLQTGIEYALYNFVFRDGVPMESPSYNMLWIRTLTNISDRLKAFDINLFTKPRMNSILQSPIQMSVWNEFSIDVGDSGSTIGGIMGKERNIYEVAFMNYRDSTFLNWLKYQDEEGLVIVDKLDFESLFRPDFQTASSRVDNEKSKLFAGYGMGLLKDHKDEVAIALSYGFHGSHYHWDFLNIELFANGQKMLPDFGYPDAMNAYVPSIYTWSKNTVAHNTVVVDVGKQDRNLPGILHDFTTCHRVQTIDASSPAYSQTDLYRRQLVVVNNESNTYTVDFFRVKGGQQHDYILHSSPGKIDFDPSEWGETLPGTYAGRDIDLNVIYDDDKLGNENYQGSYSGYKGSGFQHLFNVQKREKGTGVVNFTHVNDENSKLNVNVLTTDDQELFMTSAYDLPRKKSHLVKQIICHVKSESDSLNSTFVSVLEPYTVAANILEAKRLSVQGSSSASAVEVNREGGKDIIVTDIHQRNKTVDDYTLTTDATTAVLGLDENQKLNSVFFSNGNYLKYKGRKFKAQSINGEITGIDYENRKISIQLDKGYKASVYKNINKEVVFVYSKDRQTVHPIHSVAINGKDMTIITEDDLLVGKVNIEDNPKSVLLYRSKNVLYFKELYKDCYLLNMDFNLIGQIDDIHGGDLKLSSKAKVELFKNSTDEDTWIANLGIGDQIELKTVFEWQK